jgi:hypothetical protein
MKTLTVSEQRDRHVAQCMVSVGLEAHLRNLVREIQAGDSTKLVEFQQFLRYAPREMVVRIQELLDGHNIPQVG